MRTLISIFTLLALTLSACSSDQADVTGTYTLVSIDGNPVPYSPTHEGQQGPEVLGSSMVLNEDGTFTMTMEYSTPSGAATSQDFSGTYAQEDGDFIFTWGGAGKTRVTIKGDTLTLNNEGLLFVYEK